MRRFWHMLAAACAVVAGPAVARVAGFDVVAAAGDVVDIRVPAWMNGKVAVGAGAVGTVRRRALGRAEAIELDGVRVGGTTRDGGFGFDLVGPAVGGRLTGDCIYDASDRHVAVGSVQLAAPHRPLLLRCAFRRDGVRIGTLALDAARPDGRLIQPARRIGVVHVGDDTVEIVSLHRLGRSAIATEAPVGYRFAIAGQATGILDLSGFSRRRLAIVRDAGGRDATIVGSVVLALFWDPGDTPSE